MKLRNALSLLTLLLLAALLVGCNLPGAPTPTPIIRYITATFTASPIPPSPTPIPPTDTPAPTNTPEPIIPTPVSLEPSPTFGLPPTLPPPTPPATPTSVVPTGGALFAGSFEGGTFTFRVNDKGNMVTLKQITLKKAICQTGLKISYQLTFEDVRYFPVEYGKFTMSYDRALMSGIFTSPNAATGSLTITLINEQCRIGPISWTAYAQ